MSSAPTLLHWTSGAITERGQVRESNQDACLDRPDLGLWAVADGMGGHYGGGYASHLLVEGLDRVAPFEDLNSAIETVRLVTKEVNQELIRAAREIGQTVMGTTLVAVVALGARCAILWAGDSRVYRLRDGVLDQLTHDHSQVQWMVDSGLLAPEEADQHPLSNVLLRAVGGEPGLRLDDRVEALREGDRYLLCSDGLMKELGREDIERILMQTPGSPLEAAQALVDAACKAGGRDNVTVLVIDFQDPSVE